MRDVDFERMVVRRLKDSAKLLASELGMPTTYGENLPLMVVALDGILDIISSLEEVDEND